MRAKWGLVLLCTGLVLLTCLAAEAKNESGIETIYVDCDNGDSISKALEDKADELIIEIRGFCYENVTVERGYVTFQGADPSLDGIAGPSPGSGLNVLLYMEGVVRITIRNLTLANSTRNALIARHSQSIKVENCVIRDNLRSGAVFVDGSSAVIKMSSFENNAFYGLWVAGSSVDAIDSVFLGNSWPAVYSTEEATVRLSGDGCSIEGDAEGVSAVQDGFIWVSECSINVPNGVALSSFEQGDLNVYNVHFVGDLRAEWKSFVWLGGAYQDAPGPYGNLFAHDSTLVINWGDVALVGTTLFDSFATGSIEDGSSGSFDVLLCEDGGDFVCGSPTPANNGTVTGCGLCP